MLRTSLVVACLLSAAVLAAQGTEERSIKFARFPSLSPDGKKLAFAYQGNLWTVSTEGGIATRLTANDSFDSNPAWSADGQWIAFNSDREGGNQVFVIPSVGGRARQVTAYSPGASVQGWYPDGKSLLVLANRALLEDSLYRLDLDTGRFQSLGTDRIAPLAASLSPDGRTIAYYRGSLPDTLRKGYKGSANHDIYTMPADGSAAAKLLWRDPAQVNQMWPTWSGDAKFVYFANDEGEKWQLMRRPVAGGPNEIVARADDAIRFTTASRDGSLVVYDVLNELYALDPKTKSVRKLAIYCRTDDRGPKAAYTTFAGTGVQGYALSPDAKRTALAIRGDLFVASNERGGDAKRITATPDREQAPVWTKDGKSIVYASNRDGNFNLYATVLATLETKRLTQGAWTDQDPAFAPDGSWLAYIRGPKPSIRLMKPEGSGDHELVAGPGIVQFEWSPDGKWIAFTRTAGYWDSDIFLVPVDASGAAGKIIPLTNHPGENLTPIWFKTGDKIGFLSNRYRNRDIETLNHSGRFTIYVTPLQKEKDTFDFDEDTEAPPAKPDPKKSVEVKVDPDEIDRRAKLAFPFFEGVQQYAVHPDGQTIVFTASSLGPTDFYQISADGTNLQRLTTGGEAGTNLQWTPDGSRLYYVRSGEVRWIGKGGQGRGSLSFAARMEVNRIEDYYAVFDEAWAVMNETFYDPGFHGADWPAMKAKYRALVGEVSIRQDFNLLVNQMLGELNASHLGFGGGTTPRPARPTGVLGILADPAHTGTGVKIARIVARGPATKEESRLHVGDIILEVDGKEVADGLSFDLAMADKVGRTVSLTVNTTVSKANARKVKIKPISTAQESNLLYEEWIDGRRALVDKYSGGRLGYLHVPDMGDAARNRFERELFGFGREKEGVLLDFRFNNGGDTHDSLLQFLDRRVQYLTFVPRNDVAYRQPERIFTKPTIVVTDEFSLSDAEVFTMGYKTLKIGKVVGRPTMGWIIFTSGRGLVDGSFLRTPYIGTYASDGRNMENWGVPPDIEVFYEPEHVRAGEDPQLKRAVEELLKQLK